MVSAISMAANMLMSRPVAAAATFSTVVTPILRDGSFTTRMSDRLSLGVKHKPQICQHVFNFLSVVKTAAPPAHGKEFRSRIAWFPARVTARWCGIKLRSRNSAFHLPSPIFQWFFRYSRPLHIHCPLQTAKFYPRRRCWSTALPFLPALLAITQFCSV